MKTLHENLLEQTPRYLDELFELLRIPSVSAIPAHKPDMLHCAERYAALLLKSGADTAEIYPTKGHPVVFAEKRVDPNLPTALIYGHYDVQPADPLDLWKTPPFEPEVREGAIYGRGANDDKGQSFLHVKAMEYLLGKGGLTCNLKFLIEGEEEIGSPSLADWAADHKELLACDFILVSDTTMIDEDVPSINCGMRGLAYVQIKVTGPNKDVHSGHYGGAIANPINTLCGMIAKLVDEQGRITVPGIYDPVVELNPEERAMLARAPSMKRPTKPHWASRRYKAKRVTAPWNAQVFVPASTYVESGVVIQVKAPRRCCLRLPRQKYPCGWCPTRITRW